MRCGLCGGEIASEADVAWVRGTAVCPACTSKGRTYRGVFLVIWVVVAIFIFLVAAVVCAGFLGFFNLFMRPGL